MESCFAQVRTQVGTTSPSRSYGVRNLLASDDTLVDTKAYECTLSKTSQIERFVRDRVARTRRAKQGVQEGDSILASMSSNDSLMPDSTLESVCVIGQISCTRTND